MKKWNLAALLPGFLAVSNSAQAVEEEFSPTVDLSKALDAIEIAPLNVRTPIYIAGHRSHSSHRSHRSHRSSSGGSSSYRSPPSPSSSGSSSSSSPYSSDNADPLGQPSTPKYTTPAEREKQHTDRMALIMRVQLALKILGFYSGEIDGLMGPKTRAAIQDYRQENGLPSGNIDTQLLNSLGVSAP